MHILVTNDDGYDSAGLWCLADAMSAIGEVLVVAPHAQHSGVGTSVTLRRQLEVTEIPSQTPGASAFHVDGTPADCVIVGLRRLARARVGLIVSGINHGANLGNDVLVSGTVGGALQGHFRGIPSIAFSLDVVGEPHWETAAAVAELLGRQVMASRLTNEFFLNVNVPDCSVTQVKGVAITHVARGGYIKLVEQSRPDEARLLRQADVRAGPDYPCGTDIRAITDGFISISPLQGNPTHHGQIDDLGRRLDGLIHELQPTNNQPD
ncbi:MAG: 5'/3'-nucleotidase SurE [Dehalococcoidia bacterium]